MNSLGFGFYLAITYLGIAPIAAMTSLYALSVVISFAINNRWTFKSLSARKNAFFYYSIINLCGYAINFLMLLVLNIIIGFPHYIVQLFAIAVVAIWNFMLTRVLVFVEVEK